mmetsp:Transcript_6305/g.14507  ORF Transcript_6305/g.14507 Transcript_6305/m.14507 type:complete len:311 (-) Transcript_6305:938-1870(-)
MQLHARVDPRGPPERPVARQLGLENPAMHRRCHVGGSRPPREQRTAPGRPDHDVCRGASHGGAGAGSWEGEIGEPSVAPGPSQEPGAPPQGRVQVLRGARRALRGGEPRCGLVRLLARPGGLARDEDLLREDGRPHGPCRQLRPVSLQGVAQARLPTSRVGRGQPGRAEHGLRRDCRGEDFARVQGGGRDRSLHEPEEGRGERVRDRDRHRRHVRLEHGRGRPCHHARRLLRSDQLERDSSARREAAVHPVHLHLPARQRPNPPALDDPLRSVAWRRERRGSNRSLLRPGGGGGAHGARGHIPHGHRGGG